MARREERDRLKLKAAMVRQQSQTLTVADLDLQARKFSNMLGWLALARDRKVSGASQASTSTQDTTVREVAGRWLTLTEEYQDQVLERLRTWNCYLYPSDPSGTK